MPEGVINAAFDNFFIREGNFNPNAFNHGAVAVEANFVLRTVSLERRYKENRLQVGPVHFELSPVFLLAVGIQQFAKIGGRPLNQPVHVSRIWGQKIPSYY
jgi:hypothetical protein